MGLKAAMDRIERVNKHYNEVNALREQAKALIEDILPSHWNDGDVRYVSSELYGKLLSIGEQMHSLELGPDYGRWLVNASMKGRELNYRGQFGTIKIKDINET